MTLLAAALLGVLAVTSAVAYRRKKLAEKSRVRVRVRR